MGRFLRQTEYNQGATACPTVAARRQRRLADDQDDDRWNHECLGCAALRFVCWQAGTGPLHEQSTFRHASLQRGSAF